jgi:hypothetical protein
MLNIQPVFILIALGIIILAPAFVGDKTHFSLATLLRRFFSPFMLSVSFAQKYFVGKNYC